MAGIRLDAALKVAAGPRVVGVLLLLALAACAAEPGAARGARPALRTDESEAGTTELAAAGARLVEGSALVLAADAFREVAEVAVERRRRAGLEGGVDGLDLATPIVLRLERIGWRCRLRSMATHAYVDLTAVRCAAARD